MTVMTGNNKTPLQIQTRLATRREGIAKRARVRKSKKPLGLDLTSVRPFLRGSTHNQARVERRGTKRKLSGRQLQKLDTTRKKMYAKANGEMEVHWDQILKTAGLAGVVDPTTAARNLKEAGYKVPGAPAWGDLVARQNGISCDVGFLEAHFEGSYMVGPGPDSSVGLAPCQ